MPDQVDFLARCHVECPDTCIDDSLHHPGMGVGLYRPARLSRKMRSEQTNPFRDATRRKTEQGSTRGCVPDQGRQG